MTIKLTVNTVIPDDVVENAEKIADKMKKRGIGFFGDTNAKNLISIAIRTQSDVEPYSGQNLSDFINKGLTAIEKQLGLHLE